MLSVQCDDPDCDFKTDAGFENLTAQQGVDLMKTDWLNTPCPKCGRGVIVNEDEISVLEMMIELEKLGILSFTDSCGSEDNTNAVAVNMGALRPESEETDLIKLVRKDKNRE